MVADIAIEDLADQAPPSARLAGIDLSIEASAHVGLLGPAGAGPARLARLLAGFESPREGRIRLDGHPLGDDPDQRARVGYVPAEPGLDERATPRQLLRTAGRLHGLTTSETERRLEAVLMRVELEHLGGHAIEHLPAGGGRRLALAYASLSDPDVLVVTDPTTGLGPDPTRRVREAVGELARGRTLVVATTQPDDVEALCERVVGFEDGGIAVDGTLDELAGEQGQALDVALAGSLPQPGLDELRDHEAVVALRRDPDLPGDLAIWLADADRAAEIVRLLVDAGAPVHAVTHRDPDLGSLVADHMEGPL